MSLLRKHAAFAFVLAVATVLMLHFAWHPGLASLGDDSVGYLTLAQWLAGTASPFVREWVPFHSNFPPLFPLLLAATHGANGDALVGHVVVAVCAILALVVLYRFAARVLGGSAAASAVVVLFLLTPTAWVSILPVQSETLYLLVSLAALQAHASGEPVGVRGPREAWLTGVLIGLALLTRVAGIALVAAYVVHALVAAWIARRPRWGAFVPLVPVALMSATWLILWPRFQGGNYGLGLEAIGDLARSEPLGLLAIGTHALLDGWIASFASQPAVHAVTRLVILVAGGLALAGAAIRARRNALDGWYVLGSLAMILLWYQPYNVTRRLLYPLVPIMLVHAALFVRFAAARLGSARVRTLAIAFAAALPVLVCLPALVLVHVRSFDRAPVVAGEPETFSQFSESYTALSAQAARALVAREIAVIQGLRALRHETPPDARVLWVRPDYVALLGERRGVPWFYRDGLLGLARQARDNGVGYVVLSRIRKADLHGELRPAFDDLDHLSPFCRLVATQANPVAGGVEFALMRIDPAALDAFVAGARDAKP